MKPHTSMPIDAVNEQLDSSLDVSWLRPDRRGASRTRVLVLLGIACGAAWFSTPEGARTLTGLAATATTAVTYIVEIAIHAVIPQSV
jgi:hypothetical protein